MSEGPITIPITADTTGAFASIAELQEAIDQQARDAKIHRNTLLRNIREGYMLISQMMSSFRQAMSLIGAQIDPFYSALIGMVLSTTSMLISSASVLSATVLGAPVGAILFGLAIAFNILTTAQLVSDQLGIAEAFSAMRQELFARPRVATGRQPFGVGF